MVVSGSEVVLRSCHGASEYPALVAIWRSAVDATHQFVSPDHLAEIEQAMATDYFPAVDLTVAELDGRPVGFAGTSGHRLEMLFIEDDYRGRGIGSLLVDRVVREAGVTEVDVNEQNPQAAGFYDRKGFEVVGRSESDEAGYPYPLLHLRLRASASGVEDSATRT